MGRIAIIGAGISGLSCAEMLRTKHDVVVYEAEQRAGGHARTVVADNQPVDTGFIVYNEVNYPCLTKFFKHLNITTEPSDMSFGVRCGRLEYGASTLRGLFAQPGNLASVPHWSMLKDVLRFFRQAPSILQSPFDPTLGEFLDELKLGAPFRERFLMPMGAAIWSTPAELMMSFPAKTFVTFFQNHGLLSVSGQHPWRTVSGGSRQYVQKIAARLGPALRLGAPVTKVAVQSDGVCVSTARGDDIFSDVVLACHADVALKTLHAASDDERKVLSAFVFQDNEAVLHRDASVMPRARAAWASWNYAAAGRDDLKTLSVTYWMNRLQNLPGSNLFVTLNPLKPVPNEMVIDRHVFRHPVFSREAIAAQDGIGRIQGRHHLWFCGAWQRYGFHEDGIWSAERVARQLGAPAPWA